MVRNFLAYEPDREKAIELVRSRAPINGGKLAEAVASQGEEPLVFEDLDPERTIMVGDTPADAGAAAAGCSVLLLALLKPLHRSCLDS